MKFQNFIVEKYSETQLQKDKEDTIRFKIIKRFNVDKKVTRKELERFASDNEISIDELYDIILEIFNQFLYRRYDEKKVDREQLEKGIEHEYEHTNDREIAKIIALDHIKQISDYYDKLETFDKD